MQPASIDVHEYARLKPWAIAVCIPTLGMVSMRWHVCMLGLKAPMNTPIHYKHAIGLEVGAARNVLVAETLAFAEPRTGVRCSHLFFVDDDCLLSQSALQQLHAHQRPMVAGLYYSKSTPAYPLILPAAHGGTVGDFTHGDVIDCYAHGMGCTLIHLDVFRQMYAGGQIESDGAACPVCAGVGGDCQGCFGTGERQRFFHTTTPTEIGGSTNGPHLWSQTEDVYFCHRAVAAGYQPVVDTGVFAFHYDSSPTSETCGSCYPLDQWREYRSTGRVTWPEAVPA